ncbi:MULTISPECIES: hypothetical protein [unclassified Xanthobacter]|uniref:hypothetical protein n=1 Tax=unclassified Xanthobacter TaxID=2623496 RepID=UPI001F1E384B|nr:MULTISPECIES: hypothetical protein [unclassified Xanthobacter]
MAINLSNSVERWKEPPWRHLRSLTLTTAMGATVDVEIGTPGDGRVVVKASVTNAAGVLHRGILDPVLPIVRDPEPQNRSAVVDAAVNAGATHFGALGAVRLAFRVDAVEALAAARMEANQKAKEIREEHEAARREYLRSKCEVRRVLCWSTAYAEFHLTEAAMTPSGPLGMPGGVHIKIDPWCPSLETVQSRGGRTDGSFPGHNNIIYNISDGDWDLLLKETKDRAEASREKELGEVKSLREIEVPAAAVEAYTRWGGNSERAWEAEDEAAAALISLYAPAIEMQGLGVGGGLDGPRVEFNGDVGDDEEEVFGVDRPGM